MKRQLLRVATSPALRAAFRLLLRDKAVIFMLHRFNDPDLGTVGYDPALLRKVLAYLRGEGRELLSLSELTERVANGGPPVRGSVVFTIDDGYLDQATVAAPVFAEFDCPVTTFVTTGFLDGDLWFWWDKIEFILQHTTKGAVTVALGDGELSYEFGRSGQRAQARLDFTARCKEVSDEEKQRAIAQLAAEAEVELPVKPPDRYSPMPWAKARACEASGMTFGPHTVTHPILSRTNDEQSRYELSQSWKRLKAEVQNPVPVFCYPNGRLQDFGSREIDTLKELGIGGAVIGIAGYADIGGLRSHPEGRWSINRFSCPHDLTYFIQYASGLERAKELLRGAGGS